MTLDLDMAQVNPEKVQFKTRGPRSNKWQPMLDQIAQLEIDGPGLGIRVPEGADVTPFRNKIGQVVSGQGYTAHPLDKTEIKLRTRLSRDESLVVITCHARPSDGGNDKSADSEDNELDDLD